jgi:hypothetical protein
MKYWLEFIYTDSLPPNLPKEIYRGLYSAAHTYKNGIAQEYMQAVCEPSCVENYS